MKRSQALLLCTLWLPVLAMAQESGAQTPEESAAQQVDAKGSQSGENTENQQTSSEGQETTGSQNAQQTSSSQYLMQEQEREQVRSSQLVGSSIVNASDEEIGTIDNLLLDKSGQVVGIIVGVGGFLGIGEKHVALSWDAVEITDGQEGNYQVTTQVDRATLENAQAFKTQEQQQVEQQAQQMQQQQKMQQMQQPPPEPQ